MVGHGQDEVWAHLLNSGCAGHTYGVNGVWQVNLPDKRFGKSPAGNDWGGTPWQEAMNLPGSTQLAHAKRFLLTLPWHQLAPTTNTFTGATSAAATQTDDAHWHSAPWGGRHRWISPNCTVRPRSAGSIRRAVN